MFKKMLKKLKIIHDCKEHSTIHNSNFKDCIIFTDMYYKCTKCNKVWTIKK